MLALSYSSKGGAWRNMEAQERALTIARGVFMFETKQDHASGQKKEMGKEQGHGKRERFDKQLLIDLQNEVKQLDANNQRTNKKKMQYIRGKGKRKYEVKQWDKNNEKHK